MPARPARTLHRAGPARSARDDAGSISLLSLGFLVVTALLVAVIAAATAVHLAAIRLANLADELAIDAADTLDVPAYYAGQAALPRPDAAIEVTPGRMDAEVLAHLQERATTTLATARVVDVRSPDGTTAVVTLTMTVHPIMAVEPLLPWLDGIELRATGSARHF